MAAAFLTRGSTSTNPENKPSAHTSRRRHHGGSSSSKPESRSRRPQSEHIHAHSQVHYTTSRSSQPRHSYPTQPQDQWCPSMTDSISAPSLHTHALLDQQSPMAGITMERTPSGNSIMSDTPPYIPPIQNSNTNNTLTYRDCEAARRVTYHFQQTKKSTSHSFRKHERILRKLIFRPNSDEDFDDDAINGILTTADTIFFSGQLSGRVQWEWSSDPRYQTSLIGTTALRKCVDRDGFETLIVLSAPILQDRRYDRRLLLSAFLHELIHAYLFIMCGFEARVQGGHTDGFREIAGVVDKWVGAGVLGLGCVEADLEFFRRDRRGDGRGRDGERGHVGCCQSPREGGEYF